MNERPLIDCDAVDELAPAYAIDAVSIAEIGWLARRLPLPQAR